MYKYIAECDNYELALDILKGQYIKPKNEVFARHALATREQRESVVDELQQLQLLGKECHFKAVKAAQNRHDC